MNDHAISRPLPGSTGLFGGTFNPPHNGHVAAAADVLHRFELSRIFLIPSAQPPHKTGSMLAPAQDRFAMVSLATANDDRLVASDVEINRRGPSYSIDTVRYFRKDNRAQGALYFIVGADAFLEFTTWKDYRLLLKTVALIVMTRPSRATSAIDLRSKVEAYLHAHVDKAYTYSEDDNGFRHPSCQPVYLARVRPFDIASTQLRRMISRGQAVDRWLPPSVAAYIEEKGLYR